MPATVKSFTGDNSLSRNSNDYWELLNNGTCSPVFSKNYARNKLYSTVRRVRLLTNCTALFGCFFCFAVPQLLKPASLWYFMLLPVTLLIFNVKTFKRFTSICEIISTIFLVLAFVNGLNKDYHPSILFGITFMVFILLLYANHVATVVFRIYLITRDAYFITEWEKGKVGVRFKDGHVEYYKKQH